MRRLLLQLAPVRHDVGLLAVNVQPGETLGKRRPMQHPSLRPLRRVRCRAACVCSARIWCSRSTSRRAIGSSPSSTRRSSGSAENRCRRLDESHRHEERAGEDGIGQRVGRVVEARAVAIERRDGAAEAVVVRRKLRGDGLQESGGPQLLERFLRRDPSGGSCSTPRRASPERCARSRVCAARSIRGSAHRS